MAIRNNDPKKAAENKKAAAKKNILNYKMQPEPKAKTSYSLSGGGSLKSSGLSADLSYKISPRLSAGTSLSMGGGKPSGQFSLTYTAPIKSRKKK
jgi:hypothetical protein